MDMFHQKNPLISEPTHAKSVDLIPMMRVQRNMSIILLIMKKTEIEKIYLIEHITERA